MQPDNPEPQETPPGGDSTRQAATGSGSLPPGTTNPVVRALRRSRGRWRIFGVVAIAVALLALGLRLNGAGLKGEEDYIALITIEGIITTSALRNEVIEKLIEDDNVRGVILHINSPGGTTAGGEELFEALSRLREHKPMVAVISEVGASAAYMGAMAADHILARRLSIVGSIGVLFQHMDASGLLETIGIDFDKVASGALKAEPDVDEPMSGEVRASLQALVDDSFTWFLDTVGQRRGLSRSQLLELSDGRILNGRTALLKGLIDGHGGQIEAIEWLEGRNVPADLPVWGVYPPPQSLEERFIRLLGEQTKTMLGLANMPIEGRVPDGLVSLWRP